MQIAGLLVVFLSALSTLVAALPAPQAAKTNFKIQAKAINGSNSDYGGLWLYASHTGAGMNVPAFFPGKAKAPIFRFNDTLLETNIGSQYTYGLAFGEVEDLYAEWGALTLNVEGGTEGFVLSQKGTIVNTSKHYTWTGWRICDWVHGTPELYFDIAGSLSTSDVPKNCELVHLVPVYVT